MELQDRKNEKSFSTEPTLDEITDNVVGKLNIFTIFQFGSSAYLFISI